MRCLFTFALLAIIAKADNNVNIRETVGSLENVVHQEKVLAAMRHAEVNGANCQVDLDPPADDGTITAALEQVGKSLSLLTSQKVSPNLFLHIVQQIFSSIQGLSPFVTGVFNTIIRIWLWSGNTGVAKAYLRMKTSLEGPFSLPENEQRELSQALQTVEHFAKSINLDLRDVASLVGGAADLLGFGISNCGCNSPRASTPASAAAKSPSTVRAAGCGGPNCNPASQCCGCPLSGIPGVWLLSQIASYIQCGSYSFIDFFFVSSIAISLVGSLLTALAGFSLFAVGFGDPPSMAAIVALPPTLAMLGLFSISLFLLVLGYVLFTDTCTNGLASGILEVIYELIDFSSIFPNLTCLKDCGDSLGKCTQLEDFIATRYNKVNQQLSTLLDLPLEQISEKNLESIQTVVSEMSNKLKNNEKSMEILTATRRFFTGLSPEYSDCSGNIIAGLANAIDDHFQAKQGADMMSGCKSCQDTIEIAANNEAAKTATLLKSAYGRFQLGTESSNEVLAQLGYSHQTTEYYAEVLTNLKKRGYNFLVDEYARLSKATSEEDVDVKKSIVADLAEACNVVLASPLC